MITERKPVQEPGTDGDNIGRYEPLRWVAVFAVRHRFGGPEEGGWWYDCGELCRDPIVYQTIGCTPATFLDEPQAIAYRDRMQAAMDATGCFAATEDGETQYRAEIHDELLPSFYPTDRPRYE